MNILVVDDEYYIVKNIIENTDWCALGIEKQSLDQFISAVEGGGFAGTQLFINFFQALFIVGGTVFC